MSALVLVMAMVILAPIEAKGQGFNQNSGRDCWNVLIKGGAALSPETVLPVGGISFEKLGRASNWGSSLSYEAFLWDKKPTHSVLVGGSYSLSGEYVFLRLAVEGGLGGVAHHVEESGAVYDHSFTNRRFKPVLGASIRGGVVIGQLLLSAEVAYRQYFCLNSSSTVEGMTITLDQWVNPKWSASLGLGWRFCNNVRYDGDKCMQLKAGYGIGLAGTAPIATLGVDWFNRPAWNWLMFYGAEYGEQFAEKNKTTSAMAELGVQYKIYDTRHSDSWLLPELAIQAGFSERAYEVEIFDCREVDEYFESNSSRTRQQPAVGGYLGINFLPLKAFNRQWDKGEIVLNIGGKYRWVSPPTLNYEGVGSSEFEAIGSNSNWWLTFSAKVTL